MYQSSVAPPATENSPPLIVEKFPSWPFNMYGGKLCYILCTYRFIILLNMVFLIKFHPGPRCVSLSQCLHHSSDERAIEIELAIYLFI